MRAIGQHLPVPVTFRFDAKVTTEALQLDEMLRRNPYVTVIRITATKLQDGFPDAIVSTTDTIVGAATSLLVGQNGPPF